jgi:hypothetical protein
MTSDAADKTSSHWRTRRAIDAHFQGEATPASEHRMRDHLGWCAPCRAHYDGRLRLAALLPDGAPTARERLARGLGLAAPARASGLWWKGLAPVAVGLCVLVAVRHGAPPVEDPQARGGGARGSHLLVYEVGQHHDVHSAIGQIDRGSGLAFAYVNGAHRQRLLVFGVDEARHVYWYHPAWTDARQNPSGVAIAGDDTLHEIPQAVTQPLAGRRLQIFGAFGDEGLSVREIEAAVARAPAEADGRLRVTLPGWDVTRLDLALTGAP